MKPQKVELEILVISLATDTERRQRLKSQFPVHWPAFRVIDGIDLRDPKSGAEVTIPTPCPRLSRKPLTKAETGCALSHMRALELAANSRSHSVLILEDDVLGNDASIDSISAIANGLPKHFFMLCGGQEGLRGRRYLYGAAENAQCFRLPPVVLRFTARACAYALSPSMARSILQKQSECLDRADHWRMLLRGEREVYFSECLSHPTEVGNSHLEVGRWMWKNQSALHRVWADGVMYTSVTQILKVSLPSVSRVLGWTKL